VSEARVVTEVEYTVDVAIEADEDARAVEQVRIYFTYQINPCFALSNQTPDRIAVSDGKGFLLPRCLWLGSLRC
jgi:hypothetical protein